MITIAWKRGYTRKTLLQVDKNSCSPETAFIYLHKTPCDMANYSFVCFFNGQMIIKAEQHALNISSLHDLINISFMCAINLMHIRRIFCVDAGLFMFVLSLNF